MELFPKVMNVPLLENALGPVIWWSSPQDLHLRNMLNSLSLTILWKLNGMLTNSNIYPERMQNYIVNEWILLQVILKVCHSSFIFLLSVFHKFVITPDKDQCCYAICSFKIWVCYEWQHWLFGPFSFLYTLLKKICEF